MLADSWMNAGLTVGTYAALYNCTVVEEAVQPLPKAQRP